MKYQLVDKVRKKCCTCFRFLTFFKKESNYFPKEHNVMINFQIDNMEECLKHLEKLGVPLVKEVEKSEFGTFVTIEDPEGRWIELWQK